jgi:hypothetical protein
MLSEAKHPGSWFLFHLLSSKLQRCFAQHDKLVVMLRYSAAKPSI